MTSYITEAVRRTKDRFYSLYATLRDEWERTHEHFRLHGCPLHMDDISKRCLLTASVVTTFIILVTLPVALYDRRGDFFQIWFLLVMAGDFLMIWFLFYTLVFAAHCFYVLAFITGSAFGRSEIFLNYVGSRWGKRIDEIADEFISENTIKMVKMEQNTSELNEDGACGDIDVNGNKHQVLEQLNKMKVETAEPTNNDATISTGAPL